VQGRANDRYWFTKSGNAFVGDFFIKETLEHDAAAGRYRFTNLDGGIIEFRDDTGMFVRHVDAAGNTIEVTGAYSNGYNFTAVQRTYQDGGSLVTEQYNYDFTTPDYDALLSRVTLRRKLDGGAWQNVARASYTYYADGAAHGEMGDLATATTEAWNGSAWDETGTTMYRYYKIAPTASSSSSSSSNSSSSGGAGYLEAHLLKYVVNPESYQRLASDPDVTDPLTASDLKVAQYADLYFEYDSARRVVKERVQGGSRTFTYSYAESANADGYNSWKYKTVETLPGGDQKIVYSNYAGQTMLVVFTSGADQWCNFWKYDDDARVVLHANPSAVSGYDEQYADLLHEASGNYEYMRDGEGLIELFDYDPASGYMTAERIKHGETGAAITLREYEYVACADAASSSSSSSSSSSGGATQAMAYFTSKETVYPDDSDPNTKIITSYSYSFHNGTCQAKQKTTTLPLISASQNGSGVAATRKEVFDTYGNLEWILDERGFITRIKYDVVTGATTQMIEDVDTAQVSDEPSGWQTPTGGGLHLVTDFEHDDLGRTTQSLGPVHAIDIDGTATSVRRTSWTVFKDSDHEILTAQGYATGAQWDTFTLINPVSITKFDENGQVLEQISATRASTSGKLTASDTFAQSSYVRWTTNQYTDCCFLESTRVYHTIPSSGEGSEGTHYDQLTFGYDVRKRQNRQVTGGGTITRTVFDARDFPTKTYVGTDDTGATADDPTGGGAQGNNMVLVTEYQYDDGSDGGDGLLTEETQHVS